MGGVVVCGMLGRMWGTRESERGTILVQPMCRIWGQCKGSCKCCSLPELPGC